MVSKLPQRRDWSVSKVKRFRRPSLGKRLLWALLLARGKAQLERIERRKQSKPSDNLDAGAANLKQDQGDDHLKRAGEHLKRSAEFLRKARGEDHTAPAEESDIDAGLKELEQTIANLNPPDATLQRILEKLKEIREMQRRREAPPEGE